MLLQPVWKGCRWTQFVRPIRRWNSTGTNRGVPFSFKDISNQEDITNISYPSSSDSVLTKSNGSSEVYKPKEEVVKYILHGKFTKNNTHLTFSSVVEDKNFHKNKGLTYNDTMLYLSLIHIYSFFLLLLFQPPLLVLVCFVPKHFPLIHLPFSFLSSFAVSLLSCSCLLYTSRCV